MTITITAFERSPDGGKGLARDTRVRWALGSSDLGAGGRGRGHRSRRFALEKGGGNTFRHSRLGLRHRRCGDIMPILRLRHCRSGNRHRTLQLRQGAAGLCEPHQRLL